MKNRDTHIRSILKSLSWRFLASFTTIVIAYFITGEVSHALTIGGFEFFAKIFIYYFHERVWQLVPIKEERVKSP